MSKYWKLSQINKKLYYLEKKLKNTDPNSADYYYILDDIEYLREEQRELEGRNNKSKTKR